MKRHWVMLGAAGLLYLLVMNVTNDPPAYAYKGWRHQTWVMLGLHHLSDPCSVKVREARHTVMSSLPTDQCFRMSSPEQMRGVWIDEFEGSQFLPGASDTSPAQVGLGGTWLDVETNRIPGLFLTSSVDELRAFQIEFIGRRTLVAGKHGHMGSSDHEVVVDKLISARPIDVTPYAKKLEAWRQQHRQ